MRTTGRSGNSASARLATRRRSSLKSSPSSTCARSPSLCRGRGGRREDDAALVDEPPRDVVVAPRVLAVAVGQQHDEPRLAFPAPLVDDDAPARTVELGLRLRRHGRSIDQASRSGRPVPFAGQAVAMDTLAYIASHGGGSTRRRRDARIASVLAEYGYGAYVAPAGDDPGVSADRLARLGEADVVVCDLVCPDHDLPVEVAIASARRIPVLALVPADAMIDAWAADLLDGLRRDDHPLRARRAAPGARRAADGARAGARRWRARPRRGIEPRGDRRRDSAASSSVAVLRARPEEPRRPSLRLRGTTWTWRWGTDWLTTLFVAVKMPAASRLLHRDREALRALVERAEQVGREVPQRLVVVLGDEQDVAGEERARVEEGEEAVVVEDDVRGSSPATIWQKTQGFVTARGGRRARGRG